MKRIYTFSILFVLIGLCPVYFFPNNNLVQTTTLSDKVHEREKGFPVAVQTFDSDHLQYEEIFNEPPQRVIAVWQSSIETLLALGLGDKIIAAVGLPDEKYLKTEYRESYRRIPYKRFSLLNCESALMMDPDFIITCWSTAFTSKSLGRTDFWQKNKVNTYISEMPKRIVEYRTIEEEYRFIRDLGKIFAVNAKAEMLITNIQTEIDYVTQQLEQRKNKKTVMVIQFMGNKIKNWGTDSLQGDIVKKLHGNLALPQESFIGYEDILEIDPEIIFVMATEWEYEDLDMVRDKVMKYKPLNSLQSVKNERVYILPLYAGNYSATRLDEGIRMVSKGMYPELYGK